MKKQIIILLFMLMLGCFLVSAKTYHIPLLTIGEVGDETFGGTADAYLEAKHGTGRIFLDSFPLTKLDTQISTRYANEVACDYLNLDCSNYDFFYTIRADSTIVGGPSASASLAILTIAALKNLELRNDTIMTGTINSGGSIGPVGGIVKKAMAAQNEGFKRVLIPVFSLKAEETGNDTNLTNATNITYSNQTVLNKTKEEPSLEQANLTIQVIKVNNIDEALAYFTNTNIKQDEREIIVPQEYTNTMKNISASLCNRALTLNKNIKLTGEDALNKSKEFLININKTLASQDYYSAASYCFSLGVLMRKANLKEIDEKKPSQINKIFTATKKAVDEFNNNLEALNLSTLSELETYIIVKERLLESEESLMKTANNVSTDELAYAIERYYSGVYWSAFFKIKGKEIRLDNKYLEAACYKKLSEAEERLNYAGLYIPLELQSAKKTIDEAYAFALKKNYKMCLFKASFAKAESNLLLSSIAVAKDEVDELADQKLSAAHKLIANEQSRGFFPIMGYSYYEYAQSLKGNNDIVSTLIFSEYALELGNLEIYFPKKGLSLPFINYSLIPLILAALFLGLASGILIGLRIKINKGKAKQGKRMILEKSKKHK